MEELGRDRGEAERKSLEPLVPSVPGVHTVPARQHTSTPRF